MLAGDVHARIRAYGSLAAEVADAGVPGVVAMRYNVYVVTAAQFVADLYAHLLAGKSLGQAAAAARRSLAADPTRLVTTAPVRLQDWVVPVVYEAAPLVLLRPPERDAPVVRLTPTDSGFGGGDSGPGGVPEPPDVGFSAGMSRCWAWTGSSIPSGCCCMRLRGRGSPRRRQSSPAGTS